MKKITLFLVAIFAMVNVANAQRAWAYDLELTPSVDSYTFAFKAVTAGDATLVFYKEGLEAGTLNLGSVSAGDNTVTKTSEELLAAIQQSGDFTWGVKMSAGAIAAGSTLKEVTDQTRGIYDFYNMMDVLVDNNPESDYFGKIYIQMALNGGSDGATPRSKAQKAGLFIYDQELNELNPTSNVGIMPTLPSGYTLGSGGRDKFHRLEIDPKTGNLVYCYNIANYPAVFSINRANPTGLVTNLIDGISGFKRTCAHCFDAEGTLYVMDLASSKGTIYKIKDGVKTKWTTTDDKFVNASMTMSSDGMGGLWVAQNRGQLDNGDIHYYQLVHVTKDGTFDWVVNYDTPHGFTGSSVRGALAYDAERHILAQGRNGAVELFSVVYDAGTGVPTLTKFAVTPNVGNNIDGLHFDYAGDLYVVNSSNEKFQKFVVPTNNNTCTVPAKKSQVIKLESITLNAHPVKDYSASIVGTMKRAIQNGENTIVLTHEANGTAHIYSIEHSTKTVTEISQEGVHAAADGFLSVSDIAMTEDGKLVACNYEHCTFTASNTSYFYIWDDIAGNPRVWFTSQKSGNYNDAYMGYTMALKGTSQNSVVTISAFNKNSGTNDVRFSHHTISDGVYVESPTTYKYLKGIDYKTNYATVGSRYELNASPLAETNWIIDGENITPMESDNKAASAGNIIITASVDVAILGKKYNGASYLFHNDHHLMVAPYADGDGKLAGVKVLGITDGFDAANLVITNTDLANTIDATSAAATAYVDGDGDLTIYLFADSKVYAFSEKEYTAATYTVTATANEGGSVEGGGTYDEGATATLTATPAEHYEFTDWTGDVTSTDNPLIVEVNSDMNITANFVKKKYTLTVFVNDENKGTIDVATGSYEYGTEVTLTATPKEGYKLLAWSNKATTPSITLTMDNNKAVSAYFVKEYATDPTFTIEKLWENTHVPASTNNGYQGVGWNGTIYVQDAGNKKILTYSDADDTGTEYVTSSGVGQQIAVDEAGNLIVFNATFYTANPNAILIYEEGTTTGKEVSFTLPQPGRCDFFTASGDIYSAEGGYIYFYCNGTTVVNRLKITNGAATAADVTTDVICANLPSAGTQSNVVVDIFGNIHVESKQKSPGVYNITNLTTTTDTHLGGAGKNTLYSTIGGCTFELGGKEWWAYLAGTTDYSSEWQLYNETDGTCLSNELYLTATKTTAGATANWLNAQVVNEKTAYIYQFCPKVGVALWKVSFQENYIVSASATNGTVKGAGTYQEGATATLTATPNTGYKFVNWTKGGVEVSTEATYSFPVTENVELVANFEAITSKDPRAWAYDMKLGEEGDNYTFTFKATTAGQATISFKDKDGNALAQPAPQIMTAVAGENKFTIAKSDFESGVDAFWSITMDGAPIEGVVEVTDQSRGIYDFYNMMGVVVDNNTDSKDFGKIYVQQSYQRSYATSEAKNDGITPRANDQTSGIFIYNQELDELNSPSNVGIKPTMPSGGYTEIGSSSSAFQRLNIHPKTGNLVFSHAVSGKPAVFAINRDDMTGDVTNLLTGVADMTRSVAHCFDAEGTLYVMDFAGSTGAVYKVINGEATRITEISAKFINAYITMASDGRGGLWISQNRGQMDDAPYYYQLVHVTSTGEFDWYVNKETPHGLEGSSSRGALAYDVERKILAQGRNGKVELYSVSYEPTITLTPLHTIVSNDLGNNIDGLAFDYAGDLYVVNSSKEKFQKFTLPTADNICTVAAPALEAVRFTPVYTVSVASNNNEWGIANGGGTFEEGQNATITAVPATNYKFVNWTKEGAEVSTENPYTFAVTESATYVANFEEITKYTIDATANNSAMGTVEGAGTYYEGTEVTLTAKANGGYVFVDWSDGNTEETRTIEVTSDLNLTANFKVAVPRAWAYDLRLDADTDPANYIFTFKTTSAGTATLIFKDKDGNTQDFGTHTATATEAGEQTITIAKTVFDAATKDIYWEVELAGDAIAKMAEITDPTRNIYDFYNMMGVVVDNDPNSEMFGKIYIQQSYNGAADGIADRSDTQTAGIFIYDQGLNELNNPANVGIKPQLPYTIGANRQVFKRITINPSNGDIAFCNNTTTNGGAYAVSRENLVGEAVNLTKDIAEIQKVNALCFDDEGNLYVVANVSTSGTPNGNIYQIKTDGTYTELTSGSLFYDQEIAMASDGRGGLWIAQNRWGTEAAPLFHVNVAENKIDFKVEADKDYSDWFAGANYRGAIAYDKQRDILAVHSQACASVFQVTYAVDGTPSISKICQTPNLGRNELDGLAFDYAGDLYVVHSGTERFYKYVLPITVNTCTVPAPESQFIQKETRYTVTVEANDDAMGTATGGGEYKAGEKVTLTATAKTDYRFINWTIGSDVISTDASFEYTVPAEDVTLTANFEALPEITYELNGGVWNKYGWTSKKDMYNAFIADWKAYSGSTRATKTYEEQYGIGKSNGGIPTTIQGTEDILGFMSQEKWAWLGQFLDAIATAQGTKLPSEATVQMRFALGNFFGEDNNKVGDSYVDAVDCSGDNASLSAFAPYWGQTFPMPTQPTEEVVLNAPYREGYEFDGWYTTSDFSGAEITVVDETTNGTLYANWLEHFYTRTVTSGDFGTICLPYGSSDYIGAEFYEIAYLELQADGVTPKGIWLEEVTGALEAGKPYIFKATNDLLTVNYEGEEVLSPVEGKAGLTGTFDDITDDSVLEGNYMINQNKFWLCGTGCWLNANRAYIEHDALHATTNPVSPIPGRRRVMMGAAGENTTTGIDNLTEGGAIAPNMEGTYDVLGRKMNEPTNTGFYIVNGKKVVIVK